jgi:hypothetical protein
MIFLLRLPWGRNMPRKEWSSDCRRQGIRAKVLGQEKRKSHRKSFGGISLWHGGGQTALGSVGFGVELLVKLYLLSARELPAAPLFSTADPAAVVRAPLAEFAVRARAFLASFFAASHFAISHNLVPVSIILP